MVYESKWSLFSKSIQLSPIRNAKVKLKSSLRSQAVPNTVRMKTKITQTNPQSSHLRLQTTELELLVQVKSEFLHSHGDKPSDSNVRTQLGLHSRAQGYPWTSKEWLSQQCHFSTHCFCCLKVPESSWTEETAAHACNNPAAAASPDQESCIRGNLEKVKNSSWFLSNPSGSRLSGPQCPAHFTQTWGPFGLTQAGHAPGALQVMQDRGRAE